jgi:hypothetical protein
VIERHVRVNDAETLQIAYDYNILPLPTVPYVNLKGIKFLLDTMVESNPKAAKLRPEDIGDNDPLREIEASGFVRQIQSAAASDLRLTLPQLCQNYMSLCVRIGNIDRLRPPLNA